MSYRAYLKKMLTSSALGHIQFLTLCTLQIVQGHTTFTFIYILTIYTFVHNGIITQISVLLYVSVTSTTLCRNLQKYDTRGFGMDILSSGMLSQCVIFRSLASYKAFKFIEHCCYTHKYHKKNKVGSMWYLQNINILASIRTQWCISPFIIHFLIKVRIVCHGDVQLSDILVAQRHCLLQTSISDLLNSCLCQI